MCNRTRAAERASYARRILWMRLDAIVLVGAVAACGASEDEAASGSSIYVGAGTVIESPESGVTLATRGVLASRPPGGGEIPLREWNWDLVQGEQTSMGVTWTESPVEVTGAWNGESMRVIEVSPAVPRSSGGPTEAPEPAPAECRTVDLSALEASRDLGVIEVSVVLVNGACHISLLAIGPNSTLTDMVEQSPSPVQVEYLLEQR